MFLIRSSADLVRAFEGAMDPELRHLLAQRRDQLVPLDGPDLGDFAHIIVVQRGDTLATIEAAADVPLGFNVVTGSRIGDPAFTDSFEWVIRHGRWLEAAMVLTDDFAVVLFAPDRIDIDPNILRLLRA